MKSAQTNIKPFGRSSTGEQIDVITLENGSISCDILTYGATLRSLLVPDNKGVRRDVVLGYDTLQEYETQDGYLGATIGRFANRISKGRFRINGTDYTLATNDGSNHLHGGIHGFSHRIWSIEEVNSDQVSLNLLSKDGEEGYPGTLRVRVTYALIGASLSIHYEALSDTDTICSLTNHSYFNLSGHDAGAVKDHEIMINATRYTPSAADNIPLGCISTVENTPMDLRVFTRIGDRIHENFAQIMQAKGYDHNYVLDGCCNQLRHAASARSAASGITMRVDSTLPGLQFYTANFLSSRQGKKGCQYAPHHAFCLETQFFPDSPNQNAFPSPVLKKNILYSHTTTFSFSSGVF